MTNHTFDEFDNYRKERKAEMTLEEKLHKELDWLEIKHIDADGIIRNFLSICQQEIDEAKPKWISIKDRLPEASSELLLHTRSGSRYIGFYKESRKLFICYGVDKKEIDDINVTHWMPLPKSPEEKL